VNGQCSRIGKKRGVKNIFSMNASNLFVKVNEHSQTAFSSRCRKSDIVVF
jgi:hypothetical protein